MEDCFSVILRSGGVQLPFVKIPSGGTPNPPHLNIDNVRMQVVEVPGTNEAVPTGVVWGPNIDTIVFIPLNRYYKGIDFVIARKTAAMIYVYYIQCTVQFPYEHEICESQLYAQWEAVLSENEQKVLSYLVYLTPHGTSLRFPTKQ